MPGAQGDLLHALHGLLLAPPVRRDGADRSMLRRKTMNVRIRTLLTSKTVAASIAILTTAFSGWLTRDLTGHQALIAAFGGVALIFLRDAVGDDSPLDTKALSVAIGTKAADLVQAETGKVISPGALEAFRQDAHAVICDHVLNGPPGPAAPKAP